MARSSIARAKPSAKPAKKGTPNPTVVAKYENIRKIRPGLGKGIGVQDLINFYWVQELKNELRRAGISTTGRKLLLAHRLAAWLNLGQKLSKNQRYSTGSGRPTQKRAAKKSVRATPAAAAPTKKAPAPATPRASTPVPRSHSTASPGSVSPSRGIMTGVRRHEHKWQYFDNVKANGPWFDYDLYASDLCEDAYADWKRDPHVDVRSVKSGEWEYMVDFNSMEQQNVQHTAHTRRKIRRVTVGGQLAETEANEIRSRVLAQRQAAAKAATA